MSTEQKETQLHKMLRDMSNERPVTILSLRAALVLATWDGEEQEIPPLILTMIERMTKEEYRFIGSTT